MKQIVKIRINPQLKALCKLLDVSLEDVLQDFADNLSLDYCYSSGSDERAMAVDYFLRLGYGMDLFDYEELQEIMDEINNIRYAFYAFGNDREQEYKQYRKEQLKQLFKACNQLKKQREKGKNP